MGKLTLVATLVLLVGCAARYRGMSLSNDHPANPDAPMEPAAPHGRILDVSAADPIVPGQAPGMQHEEHDMGTAGSTESTTSHSSEHTGTAGHGEAASQSSDAKVIYECPMHPEITADKAGERCPKCGMRLVPRKGDGE